MPAPELPGRRERRRAQTLDHVATTAMQLFEANGYDTTTMEQIALQADVAKGTLYNHFATKEAILAHWVHMELAADTQRLRGLVAQPGGFEPRLMRLLDASAEWSQRHRAYLLDYFRFRFLNIEDELGAGDVDERPRDLAGLFALLVAQAQDDGTLRADVPAEHLASLLHHLYFGALMRWLTLPGLVLADEFAVIVDIFANGAGAPGKPSRRKRA
ncbi:TetR/AcrR family transcriptional regulator [Variovorax paradoxus]|uniref:DNA-binding transcriptional repressor AcrR n=1 Tax=Variovorax paradoxus TaxID=34073 RepID=A0A0H2M580_VARPD|nr:TetR/AcrR family transcriptional regulator [Variovorax paradoxus]KLN57326.1 DNA-binding transcriptional repressor AcrR [Variovorax paradoxus]